MAGYCLFLGLFFAGGANFADGSDFAENGANPGNGAALFAEAAVFYMAGDFDEALTRYAAVELLGGDAGVLACNRGNCLFRLGRYAEALCEYFAAERHRPRDGRIGRNISVTRERLGCEVPGAGGFSARFRRAAGAFRSDEYQAAGALLLAFFFLIAANAFRKGGTPALRWAAFLLLPGIVLYALSLSVMEGPRGRVAVVIGDAALVCNEPSENGDVLFSLRRGEVVRVLDSNGEWLRIEDGNEHRGWTGRSPVREVRWSLADSP
jgi:tetratricopeptide (TPR) repeat protein